MSGWKRLAVFSAVAIWACVALGRRAAFCAPALAAADVTAQARQHFLRGQTHYDLGEFPRALDEFREAYRLRDDPVLLFNIGQCQMKLGDLRAAVHSYRAYLRRAKDAPNRTEVEARVADLERRMAAGEPPPASPKPAPPPETRTPRPPEVLVKAVPDPPGRPLHKRWWPWALAGLTATVVISGLLISRQSGTDIPSSDLGHRPVLRQ